MAVFKNKKLIIFGTGLIAEELYNYFELDSSYKVKGFVKLLKRFLLVANPIDEI